MSEENENMQGEEMDTNLVKHLRAEIEKRDATIQSQQAQLRGHAFTAAGIDPTQGIGKAIAELYKGDADAEKIREFAASYGYTPTASGTEITADQQQGEVNSLVSAQAQALAQAQQAMSGGIPRDATPPPGVEANQKLADGDVMGSIGSLLKDFNL